MIKRFSYAVSILIAVQSLSIFGTVLANSWAQKNAISEVKQRVSLDLNQLDLGTQNTHSVTNASEIARYVKTLNTYLSEHTLPIRISALGDASNFEQQNFSGFPEVYSAFLSANEQNVDIQFRVESIFEGVSLSYLGVIVAIGYLLLTREAISNPTNRSHTENKPLEEIPTIETKLVVDLRKKALYLNNQEKQVALSNKPFCFYAALLRHCLDDSAEPLIHQQPIPESLLTYANETFQRLMELGHTKRKQPDFSTNLDKTLSEIRAALDEVFIEHPADKCHYYPPKAQGEGSRTKRHCYSLETLASKDIEILFD